MKIVLKIALVALAVLAVVITGVIAFGPKYVSPYVQQKLEQEGSRLIQGRVQFSSFTIHSLLPVKLTWLNLDVSMPVHGVHLLVPKGQVKVSLASFWPRQGQWQFHTQVEVDKPVIQVKPSHHSKSKEVSGEVPNSLSQGSVAAVTRVDSSVAVTVRQGRLALTVNGEVPQTVEVDPIDVSLTKSSLSKTEEPLHLNVKSVAQVKLQNMSFEVPVSLWVEDLLVSSSGVSSQNLNVSVAGLDLKLVGASQLQPVEHNWKGGIFIQDLSSMPVPPKFLPPGRWSGGLSGSIQFYQKSPNPPYLAGELVTTNLAGDLNWQEQKVLIQGPVDLQARVKFSFVDQLNLSQMQFGAQLDRALVQFEPYLSKAKGVPLSLVVNGKYTKGVAQLSRLSLKLAEMMAQVTGKLSHTKASPSDLNVKVKHTSLAGVEKLVPLLAKRPVRGRVGLEARLKGDVFDLSDLGVDVDQINVDGLSAAFDYSDSESGLHIKGPMAASLSGRFSVNKGQIKSANIQGKGDLSSVVMTVKNVFNKRAGDKLTWSLLAKQGGKQLQLNRLGVVSSAGNLRVNGSVGLGNRHKLKLKAQIKKLDLAKVSQALPQLSPYQLKGLLSSDLRIGGEYDPKQGVEKSPMSVQGSLVGSALQANYQVESKKAKVDQSHSVESAEKPQPILPAWPIVKNSQVQFKLDAKKLAWQALELKGVSVSGAVKGGSVRASGKVDKIFDGSLSVPSLSANLLRVAPTYAIESSVSGLNIKKVLTWLVPEHKELMAGRLSANVKGRVPHPAGDKWVNAIDVAGRLSAKQLFISTLKLDEMANRSLSRWPGAKKPRPVDTKGVNATLKTGFVLSESRFKFKALDFLTSQRDRFTGQGVVGLDMGVDLKGTLYLVNPPFKGSFVEANSDKQGRLVVPVKLSGNLLQPKASFVKESINQMLKKTAQYELRKLANKQKAQVNKAVDSRVKKETKNLQKQLKGQLEELLNK